MLVSVLIADDTERLQRKAAEADIPLEAFLVGESADLMRAALHAAYLAQR